MDAGEVGGAGVGEDGDLGVKVECGVVCGGICEVLDFAVIFEAKKIVGVFVAGQAQRLCIAVGVYCEGSVRSGAGFEFGKNPLGDNRGICHPHCILRGFQCDGEHADYGDDGEGDNAEGNDDLDEGKGRGICRG